MLNTRNKYVQSTCLVVACVYLYIFMEWLFFVTKPSFLSIHPWLNRALVLFMGVWPFLLTALLLHAVMCCVAWSACRSKRLQRTKDILLQVTPAIVISCLVIMLIDNFTYTVFRWGIVKTDIHTIPIYWMLSAAIFIFMLRRRSTSNPVLFRVSILLVTMSLIPTAWSAVASPTGSALRSIERPDKPLPNIIMFASDGVNADHLSAYGYKRNTSPNLDKWLNNALIVENAFTNSGMTSGSLTAMMTSKYPATTKLFYPPQTLHGEDAYQHLPGILHKLGYESLQETIPYYADAMGLNWLDSFDYANGRKLHWSSAKSTGLAQTSSQFARHVRDRIRDRSEQLLMIKPMEDKYAAVVSENGAKGKVMTDEERMSAVYDFIKRAHQPFFIHIHLSGTHLTGSTCCEWKGSAVFAAADKATPLELAFNGLDNAVLQSDRYFGQMMDLLAQRHLLENTIVVYSSDHAMGWSFQSRVPLIFIFPDHRYAGRVGGNGQLMDVPPTLLDYMGLNIPDWMEGRSLLKDDLSRYRSIFVGYRAQYLGAASLHADIGPPVYDLAKDGLVVCDRWYVLSLGDHSVTEGKVAGFQGKCDASKLPDAKTAGAMMTRHLEERGFKF